MIYTNFFKKKNFNESMFFGKKNNFFYINKKKYLIFDNLIKKQISFFWKPEDIDLFRDKIDFNFLSNNEKYIFIFNLQYQILLNYIQGINPILSFLPLVSIYELETWIQTWSFFKKIHLRSYSYIINVLLNNLNNGIFDNVSNNKFFIDKFKKFSSYYDDLIFISNYLNLNKKIIFNNKNFIEIKKKLYLCLVSVNALESICFYISYVFFFVFAENKFMECSSKIIRLISRDNNLHLIGIRNIINIFKLVKEENMFNIVNECKEKIYNLYIKIVNQEKKLIKFFFSKGPIFGLNKESVLNYIKYIANLSMKSIYFEIPFSDVKSNPLPWLDKWFFLDIDNNNINFNSQDLEIDYYLRF